jgi:hypothetical protein
MKPRRSLRSRRASKIWTEQRRVDDAPVLRFAAAPTMKSTAKQVNRYRLTCFLSGVAFGGMNHRQPQLLENSAQSK